LAVLEDDYGMGAITKKQKVEIEKPANPGAALWHAAAPCRDTTLTVARGLQGGASW